MRGLWKIFAFSFRQKFASKGFRLLSLIVAFILFLLPAILLPVLVKGDSKEEKTADPAAYSLSEIKQVFCVVEHSGRADALKDFIQYAEGTLSVTDETAKGIRFSFSEDMDRAGEAASGSPGAVILRVLENEQMLLFHAVLPEGSGLARTAAESLAGDLSSMYYDYRLLEMNLSEAQRKLLTAPISAFMLPGEGENQVPAGPDNMEEAETPKDSETPDEGEKILGLLVPVFVFLNTMIIYMLVLFNNKDLGQSVILEKSSKLMDTFLVSVKPRAMIFGKVMAVWLTSLLQCFFWILALIAGLLTGMQLARHFHPNTAETFDSVMTIIREGTGLLSLPNILLALAMVAAGFLLYMSLAAIFASFASRQEELSASQGIFTMVLIVSYFVAISQMKSVTVSGSEIGAAWYDFIPFISCMLTPAKVLAGIIGLAQGAVSLLISLLLAALLTVIAGSIYSMMSLYKGNMPKPADMMKMLLRKG